MLRQIAGFGLILLFSMCSTEENSYETISGATMGTSYNIIVQTNNAKVLESEVNEELIKVNKAASTYDPNSIISLFNRDYRSYQRAVQESKDINNYFIEIFDLANEIYDSSEGAFDPTVMPLVNYWGFGYSERVMVDRVDSVKVTELLDFVGFSRLTRNQLYIEKDFEDIELDFSAIAKGYGVDKIAALFDARKIKNYYIEIGGEVYARGKNSKGVTWRTGIGIPSSDSNPLEFQEILELEKRGIATSGNYRNFYEVNGKMVSHTINPATGFPERNELLSATIIAPSCAKADGYATACMVLGREKATKLIEDNEELEGILIYGGESGFYLVYDSTKKE